jgi:transketolase
MPDASTQDLARRLRVHVARMTHRARASHIGACYSIADIVAVLYGGALKLRPQEPAWAQRDRFILSKGHATAVLYAALAEAGYFAPERLDQFCANGSALAGHVVHEGVPGVELSTGALGHGLSMGCGLAWGLRLDASPARVVCLMGDGELDEGSVWEAALFAGHHALTGLVAIVDVNAQQGLGATEGILNLEPLADKWRAFRWEVATVDGHDHAALRAAIDAAGGQGRPTVILASTVKGKGVSFMEGQLAWHYRSLDDALLAQALKELGA